MNLPPEIRCEVSALLGAMREGDLDAAGLARLDQLVSTDAEVRRLYLNYVNLCASLHWSYKRDEERETQHEESRRGPADEEMAGRPNSVPTAPPVILTAPVVFPSVSSFSSLAGSVLVSYLTAALIVGVGLLIASAWKMSDALPLARSWPAKRAPLQVPPEFVGRITGMVDCQWGKRLGISDKRSEDGFHPSSLIPHPSSPVSFGDKFALASGLMEITYDTGAKVILQGPVSYEVESNGGYLSLGKLTGKLEAKAQDPTPKTPVRSSFILHPSSFAIRTPTAVVTDLGTEFGVTVARDGLTQIHVLQGMVDARHIGPGGDDHRGRQILAGSAVEIKPQAIRFEPVAFAPQSFARQLRVPAENPAEAAYIQAVLADKPLGYWPLSEPAGARRFLDRSGNSFHGYAMNRVMAGQAGPLLGNSRAVTFEGKGYIDVGRHDEFALVNDFTVEAWVCIGSISSQLAARVISATPGSLPSTGGGRAHGWSLEVSRQANQNGVLPPAMLRFTTYSVKDYELTLPNEMVSEDQWAHMAVVCDRGNTAHFYLNGKHRQSIAAERPGTPGPVWLEIGGGTIRNDEFWHGRLAHLAVYPRALTAEQIENHFNQGGSP